MNRVWQRLRQGKRRRSILETLEQKVCLTVSVALDDGSLLVSGDADGIVEVSANENDQLEVTDAGVLIGAFANVSELDIKLDPEESGESVLHLDLDEYDLEHLRINDVTIVGLHDDHDDDHAHEETDEHNHDDDDHGHDHEHDDHDHEDEHHDDDDPIVASAHDSGLPADFDDDGVVGTSDFLILSEVFGQAVTTETEHVDLDHDGKIDVRDFLLLSKTFGQTSVIDITDVILTNRSADCADYVGSYTAQALDIQNELLFTSMVTITADETTCTIESDSVPNHEFNDETAAFAGGAEGATITATETISVVPRFPEFADEVTQISTGVKNAIFLNGVRLDIVAAGCYRPSQSQDESGNVGIGCQTSDPWLLDALGSESQFGVDEHNGHTQPGGLYHYHGNPNALFNDSPGDEGSPVIGFAADGFPVYGSFFLDYDTGEVREAISGYTLKEGSRGERSDTNPGGEYDGEYVDDWEFTDAGDLDECNGMTVDGQYGYYITDSFPWGVRCLRGTPDESFLGGGGGGPGGGGPPGGGGGAPPTGDPNATLPESAYAGDYTLMDEEFGTMVTVTVSDETRTIVANAIPDHEVGDFPNSGNPNTISEQSLTLEFPIEGTYVGTPSFALSPGVAVNGVPFIPGTAETVTCDSGEVYRVEAIQEIYNLGLDFNNAHVQPNGQYHYHGVSELLVDAYATEDDLVHVGFAADGFLVYYSKSNAYESGYVLSTEPRTGTDCVASGPAGGDTVEIAGTVPDGTYGSDWVHTEDGDLDECNGTTIGGEYAYFITDAYPYVSRCLMGEVAGGGGGPGGGDGPGGGGPPARPDFEAAAIVLGVSEQEIRDAVGEPPPNFDAAAELLGIMVDDLLEALGIA